MVRRVRNCLILLLLYLDVCAQLTRDLFAIVQFLSIAASSALNNLSTHIRTSTTLTCIVLIQTQLGSPLRYTSISFSLVMAYRPTVFFRRQRSGCAAP